MGLVECVRLALDSIKANKLRALLTMLGIIIGISSVITITTIGNSMQKTLSSTMNSLGGTNLIYVNVNAVLPVDIDWDTFEYPEVTEQSKITYDDLLEYQKHFEGKVASVLVTENGPDGSVEGKKVKHNVNIQGVTPGYIESSKIDMIEGRDLTAADVQSGKAVALVSDLYVKYACDGKAPIGQVIHISLQDGSVADYYVVGVYKYDANKFGFMGGNIPEKDIKTPVFSTYTSVHNQFIEQDKEGIMYFQVIAAEGTDPTQLAEDTKTYFGEKKYSDGKWELQCMDMASQLSTINNMLNIVTIAIAVIAAISLVVGGVGVMNIMLVSVVERTREIGIRKALGAKNSSIQLQFITESIVICFVGGVIGIISGIINGLILSQVAATMLGKYMMAGMDGLSVSVSPSVPAIIVSVVFSMLIGIVFGFYPARRAAKMSPIDALRFE